MTAKSELEAQRHGALEVGDLPGGENDMAHAGYAVDDALAKTKADAA